MMQCYVTGHQALNDAVLSVRTLSTKWYNVICHRTLTVLFVTGHWALNDAMLYVTGHKSSKWCNVTGLPAGRTALHWASAVNNADAVMTLLKHNANRDAQDNKVRNGCRCEVIKGYRKEGWCACVCVCVCVCAHKSAWVCASWHLSASVLASHRVWCLNLLLAQYFVLYLA